MIGQDTITTNENTYTKAISPYQLNFSKENLPAMNLEELLNENSREKASHPNWRTPAQLSSASEEESTEEEDEDIWKQNIEDESEITLNIEIEYVESCLNCQGNYNNYVSLMLRSMMPLIVLEYSHLLESKKKLLPESRKKKTLILDLDETLIHSDFEGRFEDHDHILPFTSIDEDEVIPLILRPGVFSFLNQISEYFEVMIFTASRKDYADLILDYLDPQKKIIQHRFYREDCIQVNNRIYIKDLRIFSNRNLKDMVIIDNSMYSFCQQLSNGVLINSFYHEKEDRELCNVYNYLMEHILNCGDVREVNEELFNFSYLMELYTRQSQGRDDII